MRKLLLLFCLGFGPAAHAIPIVYEFNAIVNSVDDCTINCEVIPGTYAPGDQVTGVLRYNPDAEYHPGARDTFWKVFSYDIWINDIHIFDSSNNAYPSLMRSSVPDSPGVSTSLHSIDEVPLSTGGLTPPEMPWGYDEFYINLFGDVLNWVSVDRLPERLNLDGITSGEIIGHGLPRSWRQSVLHRANHFHQRSARAAYGCTVDWRANGPALSTRTRCDERNARRVRLMAKTSPRRRLEHGEGK